ncbi:uncharacterized protein LOC129595793 [Paramacrobiotus metropolitanus]|uniref:uncharacterized protein LOC129595793 n=1 Tax=Paramacrobiotus metropolitanus TaxID=2943436 RepID=UPI002445ADD1|nr:uncharacterized protein LOC129595793 [Paramacrobiotus metropolitanus]
MSCGIYQPSSVDVLDPCGLVRHGRVVDVSHHGFFVDFLCPSQRRQFFPYGSDVFLTEGSRWLCKEDTTLTFNTVGEIVPVEVLMRETPTSPWTWFPGEMIGLASDRLLPDSCNIAVIHWGTDLTRADIVPIERIRWRVPSGWWTAVELSPLPEIPWFGTVDDPSRRGSLPQRVTEGTFKKYTVPFPKEFCHFSGVELRRLLSGGWGLDVLSDWPISLVDIEGERLRYIECMHQPVCDHESKIREFLFRLGTNLPRNIPWNFASSLDLDDANDFKWMPMELWLEAFSQLDTLTQTMLRAVCSAWNDTMDSLKLASNLIIKLSENNNLENYDLIVYSMIAPIFARLTTSTKRIIVVNRWECYGSGDNFDALKVLDMIHYVAARNPLIQLASVNFVRFRLDLQVAGYCHTDQCKLHQINPADIVLYGDRFEVYLDDFVDRCRSLPCAALRLTNSSVFLDTGHEDFGECHSKDRLVRITTPLLALDVNFESLMWEAFEFSLAVPNNDQLGMVSEWFAALTGEESIKMVCKVLCETHTIDPRPWLHYRGKKWCLDGLKGIDLTKLSGIAMYFLIDRVKPPTVCGVNDTE